MGITNTYRHLNLFHVNVISSYQLDRGEDVIFSITSLSDGYLNEKISQACDQKQFTNKYILLQQLQEVGNQCYSHYIDKQVEAHLWYHWKPKFNCEVRNTASEHQIHSYTLIIYDNSLPIPKVLDYYYYHGICLPNPVIQKLQLYLKITFRYYKVIFLLF